MDSCRCKPIGCTTCWYVTESQRCTNKSKPGLTNLESGHPQGFCSLWRDADLTLLVHGQFQRGSQKKQKLRILSQVCLMQLDFPPGCSSTVLAMHCLETHWASTRLLGASATYAGVPAGHVSRSFQMIPAEHANFLLSLCFV